MTPVQSTTQQKRREGGREGKEGKGKGKKSKEGEGSSRYQGADEDGRKSASSRGDCYNISLLIAGSGSSKTLKLRQPEPRAQGLRRRMTGCC